MAFDRMKYKILVYGKDGTIMDLSKYFMGGQITEGLDAPATARFEFMDKYGIIENYMGYTGTFPIEMRVRTNSTGSFVRAFLGDVENVDVSIGPEGDRKTSFNAFGSPTFRHNYISPNQAMIGNCDFGTLFTGTPNITYSSGNKTWSTTWGSDSAGNYPNGLLYDSGYSYSANSIVDAYPGISDVPIQVKSGAFKKLDYIKEILNPYDYHFYLDDGAFTSASPRQLFRLLKGDDSSWDWCDWFRFQFGSNINSFEKRIRLADVSDKIIVVGTNDTDVFAIEGSGTHEYFYSAEAKDLQTARQFSIQQLEMNSIVPKSVKVTTLPVANKNPTESDDSEDCLIGHRVDVYDTNSDPLETCSVFEMTQNFDVDRWTTDFVLSRERPTDVKLFNEIRDDIKRLNDEGVSGRVYLRADMGTGSEYYLGLLLYSASNYNGDYYPCAIGLGTSGDTTTHTNGFGGKTLPPDSYFAAPIAIRALIDPPQIDNITSTDADKITTSAWVAFPARHGLGLVKEIVMFANNLAPGGQLYTVSQTNSCMGSSLIETPYPNAEITSSGIVRGFWPVALTSVNLLAKQASASAWGWKAKDATVAKEMWWQRYLNDTDSDPVKTGSWWKDGEAITDSKNMSVWTNYFTSSDCEHVVNARAPNVPQVLLEFTSPVPFSKMFASRIGVNASALVRIWSDKWGWDTASWAVRIWNNSSSAWEPIDVSKCTFSQDAAGWPNNLTRSVHSIDTTYDSTGTAISNFIDDKNIMRFLIYVVADDAWYGTGGGAGAPYDATYSLHLNYFDVVYEWTSRYDNGNLNTGTDHPSIIEQVVFDIDRESFKLSFQPVKIEGLWLDGSWSGQTWVPSGENLISRFNARDLALGSKEVFTSYQQDFLVTGTDASCAEGYCSSYDVIRFAQKWSSVFTDAERLKLRTQANAIISYSTNQSNAVTPLDYKEAFHIEWVPASAGSRSNLVMKWEGAPPMGNSYVYKYSSVGPEILSDSPGVQLYKGVIAGRAVMSTDSSIREGINKNGLTIFDIHTVLDGAYYPNVSNPPTKSTKGGIGFTLPSGDDAKNWLEKKLMRLELLGYEQ